ncbi:ABC transporter permease [Microbaculum marinisediminis]|uniref:ABC transporter permease n=1 Tax=Microbaculum marinisediminis TaxID=2931392 RepID=A0AAW5R543_9HYPH|nr:ABC transporter permease [Microbaculum sp. A6E488]MCT8973783.1 ABC transporter permease [Microbaculum sp. A6E488]
MNISVMIDSIPALLGGAGLTLQLVGLAVVIGFVIAVLVALARLSRSPLLWLPAYGFVFFFRGTPLLVQIFLIYYGLSQFSAVRDSALWVILREPFWCALIAFSLNTAAYSAEIVRGAIQAVPRGQIEAAMAIGMSRLTRLRRIVMPQAVRIGLPAYGNEVILLIKASSLASTVTLLDLTGVARTISSVNYMPVELLSMAALIYLAMTFVVTRAFKVIEYLLSGDRRQPPTAVPLPDQPVPDQSLPPDHPLPVASGKTK